MFKGGNLCLWINTVQHNVTFLSLVFCDSDNRISDDFKVLFEYNEKYFQHWIAIFVAFVFVSNDQFEKQLIQKNVKYMKQYFFGVFRIFQKSFFSLWKNMYFKFQNDYSSMKSYSIHYKQLRSLNMWYF